MVEEINGCDQTLNREHSFGGINLRSSMAWANEVPPESVEDCGSAGALALPVCPPSHFARTPADTPELKLFGNCQKNRPSTSRFSFLIAILGHDPVP